MPPIMKNLFTKTMDKNLNNTLGVGFIKTVIQNLTANLIIMGLGFITSIMLARMLGPDGRGTLEAIRLWPMLLITLSMFGLGKAISYYSAQDPNQAASYFATGWLMLIILAVPVILVGWFIIPVVLASYDEATIQASRTFLLLIPIQFIGNLPYWSLQGLGKFTIWNTLRSLFSILWLLVILIAIFTDQKTAYFLAYGYLIAMTFNCAIWMFFMIKTVPGPYKPNGSFFAKLARYALPATFTFMPQELNRRLDQMLIALFLPAQTLGLYVVAVAWSNLLLPIMTPISQAIFPKVAGTNDLNLAHDYGIQTVRISILIAFSSFFGLFFITPIVFPIFYGSDFKPAIPAAIVLVGASVIKSIGSVTAEVLSAFGKPKVPMKAEFIGLAGTLFALLILLQPYGLMGAAIASLLGYGMTVVSLLIFLIRETAVSWRYLIPTTSDIIIIVNAMHVAFSRILQRFSYSSEGV